MIAKLKELGTDDPDINSMAATLYDGAVDKAAVSLRRCFEWLAISAKLHSSLGLPEADLRKLYMNFLDHGLSKEFFEALDAAIKSANAYREQDKKVLISYIELRAVFHRTLASIQSIYLGVKLDDSAIAELELNFLAGDGNRENLYEALKRAFENRKRACVP